MREDAGVEIGVEVEIEESTFWERVSFWVWGFLYIPIFRHNAVPSSSTLRCGLKGGTTGIRMAKRHKTQILAPQDFDTTEKTRQNNGSK